MTEKRSPALGVAKHTELTDKEVAGIIDHADGSVTPAKLSFGTMRVVEEKVLTSAQRNVEFTGLDLDAARFYVLMVCAQSMSMTGLYMFFNDDTNHTNYWNQRIRSAGTDITASRSNDASIMMLIGPTEQTIRVLTISRAGANKVVVSSDFGFDMGGSVTQCTAQVLEWQTAANVTKITLTVGAFPDIAAGSRFVLLAPA